MYKIGCLPRDNRLGVERSATWDAKRSIAVRWLWWFRGDARVDVDSPTTWAGRTFGNVWEGRSCDGFEMVLELMIHQQLGPGEPLATYGKEDRWEVWTREQATKALRGLVGKQGLTPSEYALHAARIGEQQG